MFGIKKMVLSLRKKKVFCENMTCKFSFLLLDLAILYYRTKG